MVFKKITAVCCDCCEHHSKHRYTLQTDYRFFYC